MSTYASDNKIATSNIDDANVTVNLHITIVAKRADTSIPASKVIIASIKINTNMLVNKTDMTKKKININIPVTKAVIARK